ncbi:hypothetical protein EV356DRAFT_442480 [Viridothelium virens]|uniref:Transcription factor CBF/NF-Y/archaeal histone domain-containing protein n=1 Tax=Viridothelium virens TaxID=1048519 RepID=A0A6A6HGB9_VIRVR|nr:hypothetical protein EV356DRAFT_442480 [Viridothelium virens]
MDREAQDTQAQGLGYEFEVKEQDRWLPIANVARIMKTALPENAKIAKEAKECMQECVSEFISFITSEASEKCQQEKRKTVNGEDILFAMTSLGFENYAEALKIYLARYREVCYPTFLSNHPHKPNLPSSKRLYPPFPSPSLPFPFYLILPFSSPLSSTPPPPSPPSSASLPLPPRQKT